MYARKMLMWHTNIQALTDQITQSGSEPDGVRGGVLPAAQWRADERRRSHSLLQREPQLRGPQSRAAVSGSSAHTHICTLTRTPHAHAHAHYQASGANVQINMAILI